MPPLSCRQAAGARTPANQKSTVLLPCWWRGGFQGALFHNATLSNIKNTKGNKTEQGWSTRWIQQWRWFLKMSLKTIITDAVTLSFATKRTTAEAQYTVIRCKQEKSASLGKSIVNQHQQLRRNRRSDKVQGGSGSIHAPNSAFWNLIQMYPQSSDYKKRLPRRFPYWFFWSFCLSYLNCLQVYSWQDSSPEKNPRISNLNTAKSAVINLSTWLLAHWYIVLGAGVLWGLLQIVWHWFIRYLWEQEAFCSHKSTN